MMAFILQVFAYSIAGLLSAVVTYIYWILFGAIIASILFSWFPSYPSSRFFQAIYDAVRSVTNPILWPIRSRMPLVRLGGFGLDLSPLIAIFGLSIARSLLLTVINEFLRPVTG
jgi:YggT family protein